MGSSLAKLDSDLIEAVYSTSAEPEGLQDLVGIIRRHIDVDSAGVWMSKGDDIFSMVQTPDLAESIGPYLDYYVRLDPWSAVPQPPGKVALGSELADESNLLKSEFYNDFARRYGMLRPMGVVLDLGDGVLARVATNRTEGKLLGPADKRRLEALSVHLKGALKLRRRLQSAESHAQILEKSLDALGFGCVACAADGTISYANAAATRLAAAGSGVVIGGRRGKLAGSSAVDTRRIETAIWATSLGEPGHVRLKGRDGIGLSLLATPLSRSGSENLRGDVLVTMARDDAPSGPDAATLQRLFDLSPAQAALAHQLSRGLTFEAAAAERGIALSTARTHFLAVLRKSGADNLRDLLRLMAALPKTIVGFCVTVMSGSKFMLPMIAIA